MKTKNQCHCCLQRPAVKDLQTPHSRLGITETYLVMIEECFVIKLTPRAVGICMVCIEQLREACRFKMQVQHCQAKLQARMDIEMRLRDEDIVDLESEDDLCNQASLNEDIVDLESEDDLYNQASLSQEALGLPENEAYDELPMYEEMETLSRLCDGALDELLLSEEASKKPDVGGDGADDVVANVTRIHAPLEECLDEYQASNESIIEEKSTSHAPLEECLDEYQASNESIIEEKSTSLQTGEFWASGTSAAPVPARFRQQLALACGMKVENPPGEEAPHASQTSPATSYHEPRPASRVEAMPVHNTVARAEERVYTRDTCEAQLAGKGPREGEAAYCCDMCSEQFTSKTNLIRHISTHMDLKLYTCHICKKTFVNTLQLNTHLRRHCAKRPYVCGTCKKRYKTKHHLNLHERSHRMVKPFKCDQCSMRFGTKSGLDIHKSTHDDVNPYKCEKCNAEMAANSSLHSNATSDALVKPYGCEDCYKQFKFMNLLVTHNNKHTNTEQKYSCDECNKQYSKKGNLMRHLRVHAPYDCEECGKAFIRKEQLHKHKLQHTEEKNTQKYSLEKYVNTKHGDVENERTMKLVHKTNLPYVCQECGKKFDREGNLNRHKIVHTGEKPFKCKECDKRYTQQATLNDHVRRQHVNIHDIESKHKENLFTYDIQGQEQSLKSEERNQHFSQQHCYDAHKRTHTGEKPYCCELCNNRFSSSSELERHLRIHSDEKSYECEICETIFFEEASLTIHLETHRAKVLS